MNALYRYVLLTGWIVAVAAHRSNAQYEYVATLDYQNLSVSRILNVPGVTYITENSAYDRNHRRYFFEGNASELPPVHLYTVDAASGAVLSGPVILSNNPRARLTGLQYDDVVDTLYAMYVDDGGNASLAWVEPATGIVHAKTSIPSLQGLAASTYDVKDHLYICKGGSSLFVIDAFTGEVVYNPGFAPGLSAYYLQYDNTSGRLYAICQPSPGSTPQFDSITLTTGTAHVIADLPDMTFPQIYAYALDEVSGKYFFLGSDPVSSSCSRKYLYVVDINTGNVLSKTLYPYAQNPGLLTAENVLNFCFDNDQGVLYALNWHPPPPVVNPYVNIIASNNPICLGAAAAFTATPGATLSSPSYRWQVNGVDVGADNPVYATNNLQDKDTVYCIIMNNDPCTVRPADTSNKIVMKVNLTNSSLSVVASSPAICAGDTVSFTALPQNGGNDPSFQWLVNGTDAGVGKNIFTTGALTDGDIVSCIMTGSLACSLPVQSTNTIRMTVNVVPKVAVGQDTVITRGKSVRLNPAITGDIARYQWTPPDNLNDPSVSDPVASPLVSTTYQLKVIGVDGCPASGKITIDVSYPLLMPNAFTPDGNGKNEIFRIPPSSPQKIISFSVFNRWGERVFFTKDANRGWSGRFNDQPQPAGVYVWKIDYEDLLSKKSAVAAGNVVLIR